MASELDEFCFRWEMYEGTLFKGREQAFEPTSLEEKFHMCNSHSFKVEWSSQVTDKYKAKTQNRPEYLQGDELDL